MPVKSSPRAARARPRTTERTAQKRRTRKAIVDATAALIARGRTPSVHDIAAAADVSRRTVYLHFPTFDQLLIDATLGLLSQVPVDSAIEEPSGEQDADARVERMVRALHHVTPELERLGRSLIRLTVEGSVPPGDGMPRRGYRRIEWIESALAPWRDRFDDAQWRRLVCGLTMVVGWEALIVQRDICGLSGSEGEALSVWAARALMRAALDEKPSPAARRGGPKGRRRRA